MTTSAADPLPRCSVRRGAAEPWLLAAFLFLFAVLGSPMHGRWAGAQAQSSSLSNIAERGDRGVLRASVEAVRAVLPKGANGGKDLLAVRSFEHLTLLTYSRVGKFTFVPRFGPRARAFNARAPPVLTA